jgi:hypothetical protein
MAEARKRTPHIWTYLRSALGLPETCPEIIVDDGGSWYNVVIHSVPVPPPIVVNGTTIISARSAITWLRSWSVTGVIQATSFMCSEDDLAQRSNAPLRVALFSPAGAQGGPRPRLVLPRLSICLKHQEKTACSPPMTSSPLPYHILDVLERSVCRDEASLGL